MVDIWGLQITKQQPPYYASYPGYHSKCIQYLSTHSTQWDPQCLVYIMASCRGYRPDSDRKHKKKSGQAL